MIILLLLIHFQKFKSFLSENKRLLFCLFWIVVIFFSLICSINLSPISLNNSSIPSPVLDEIRWNTAPICLAYSISLKLRDSSIWNEPLLFPTSPITTFFYKKIIWFFLTNISWAIFSYFFIPIFFNLIKRFFSCYIIY